MPEITFDVPAALAQELNEMAQDAGYTNAKEMTIRWLRDKVRRKRMEDAEIQIRAAIEQAAGQEVEAIL